MNKNVWQSAFKRTSKSANDVVAHTPDPDRYHPVSADPDLSRRLGGSGAIISRARADGAPRGFSVNHTSPVVVRDRLDPQNRPLLNYEVWKLDRDAANARTAAAIAEAGGVDTPDKVAKVVAILGRPLGTYTEEETIPPYLTEGGEQEHLEKIVKAATPAAIERQEPMSQPQGLTVEQVRQIVADAVSQASTASKSPNIIPLSHTLPLPIPSAQPSVDISKMLQLAFIAADGSPIPPKHRVVFNFDGLGTMDAFFHFVDVSARCVALVYDNRYAAGTRYLPAEKNGPIEIDIVDDAGASTKYRVISVGQQFNLGCFDVVVLFRDYA